MAAVAGITDLNLAEGWHVRLLCLLCAVQVAASDGLTTCIGVCVCV